MQGAKFEEFIIEKFHEILAIREKAHVEYAQRNKLEEDDAFANFKRHAKNLGLRPEQIWAVYASKHWDGIVSWIAGNETQREPIENRIDDEILYLFLLRGMIHERDITGDRKSSGVQ